MAVYTPPDGGNIIFRQQGNYTPPYGGNIIFRQLNTNYQPPSGSSIDVSESTSSGDYTPPPGYDISFDDNDLDIETPVIVDPDINDITIPDTDDFEGSTDSDDIVIGEPDKKYKMAIIENNGMLEPLKIQDAGKNIRYFVYENGNIKKRVASEGKPIVLNDDNEGYKIISANEELVI